MGSSHSSAGHAKPSIFGHKAIFKKNANINRHRTTAIFRQLLTPNQIIENLLEVHLRDEPTLAAGRPGNHGEIAADSPRPKKPPMFGVHGA